MHSCNLEEPSLALFKFGALTIIRIRVFNKGKFVCQVRFRFLLLRIVQLKAQGFDQTWIDPVAVMSLRHWQHEHLHILTSFRIWQWNWLVLLFACKFTLVWVTWIVGFLADYAAASWDAATSRLERTQIFLLEFFELFKTVYYVLYCQCILVKRQLNLLWDDTFVRFLFFLLFLLAATAGDSLQI